MTNPSQLNAWRIACLEIMGWKNVRETTIWRGRVMRTGIFGTPPGQDVDLMPNEPTPDPERVTDDALALLGVMRGKGCVFELNAYKGLDWRCTIGRPESGGYRYYEGEGPTLRAAIVQAVLKAGGKL